MQGQRKKAEDDKEADDKTETGDSDSLIPSDIPSGTFNGGSSRPGGSAANFGPGGDDAGGDTDGGLGSGSMMSGSGMSGMMGGSGGSVDSVITEYKLVRFFDFTAEPKKNYI